MDDKDGYFGERVAARYDESLAHMFEPAVVDAAVEVLVGLVARVTRTEGTVSSA
jgi:hypothetical protein